MVVFVSIVHCVMENRHILKCCVEGVLFCGRQCIAQKGS